MLPKILFVRSVRIDDKVKQVTQLNLGRHFALGQSLWTPCALGLTNRWPVSTSRIEINLSKAAAVEADRIVVQFLSKPRTEKRLDKLHERIGRLKEKSKDFGQHYDIDLLPDVSGKQAAELRWTILPQAGTRFTHPGV